MPIFGLSDTIEDDIREKENVSLIPQYDTDRVDSSILVTLPGLKWEVTYFNRNITNLDLVIQYDPNLDITLQEYNRYNNFIINVDTPLPNGIPDNLTGSGIIDCNFTPTPNDIFLTKLPDGRIAIFTITGVARMNYNNNDLYKLEYSINTAIDNINDPIYIHILESIDKEFYYNKDFRLHKDNQVLEKKEYFIREKYLRRINKLVNYWSNSFITNKTNFIMGYVKDDVKYYDIYMERFIKSIIGIENISQETEYLDYKDNNISLLDYIINTDIMYDRVVYNKSLINPRTYGSDPYLYSIIFSGSINHIVKVTEVPDDTINELSLIINNIFPKVSNKFYICRGIVYNALNNINVNIEDLTTFELTLINLLKGNVINIEDIDTIYENIYRLGDEEKFYFIPIFVYIIKYYLTTFTIKFV